MAVSKLRLFETAIGEMMREGDCIMLAKVRLL